MTSLPALIPDVDYLLSLEPEELATYLLVALKSSADSGMVHGSNFASGLAGRNSPVGYSDPRGKQIERAITEAWNWLEVQGLLVPASSTNGSAGWRIFSRRAESMTSPDDVAQFARSRRIERGSLHPRIRQKVWSAYLRGEFDVAVMQAMKGVEVYVREAGDFTAADYGVDLMRRAFHEDNGPLTDKSVEKSERQARASLFAGAIGSYKNPHSHREVNIEDPDEAFEIVLFANHLLRIIDGRIPAKK
jgi:uncharacterized protein (TIGR02391 family)